MKKKNEAFAWHSGIWEPGNETIVDVGWNEFVGTHIQFGKEFTHQVE